MLQVESASPTGFSGDTQATISDYFPRLSGILKFGSNTCQRDTHSRPIDRIPWTNSHSHRVTANPIVD